MTEGKSFMNGYTKGYKDATSIGMELFDRLWAELAEVPGTGSIRRRIEFMKRFLEGSLTES